MNLKRIEEISLKMTPSLEEITYDGWVLKFFKKYSFKTNSINPLYCSSINLNKKIKECDRIYLNKGFTYAFRITPFSLPQDLDMVLSKKGYKKKYITRMLYLDIINKTFNPNQKINYINYFEEWLNAHKSIGKYSDIEANIHKDFHKSLAQKKCLMLIKNSGINISCGMGLINKDYFGIFDVKTCENYQNKGYATELIESMLYWAKQNRAKYAYLNVDIKNTPACKLYYKMGFKEIYKYWFRVKDDFF